MVVFVVVYKVKQRDQIREKRQNPESSSILSSQVFDCPYQHSTSTPPPRSPTPTMFSRPQATLRALARSPISPVRRMQVRQASHGPSYNEPSGYIFGERVSRGDAWVGMIVVQIDGKMKGLASGKRAALTMIAGKGTEETEGDMGVSLDALFRLVSTLWTIAPSTTSGASRGHPLWADACGSWEG
jgi:hypothetical protein